MAITAAGIDKSDIDQVIFATLNPDFCFPGNGVFIEDLLGLKTAGAMDIRNQCTGFVYGLAAADGFIQAGVARTVLLIGCEIQSNGLDLTTRGRDIAVLFGDGAGAAIIQATDENKGIIASVLHSQGRFAQELWCEAPVSNLPGRIDQTMIDELRHYPRMNGRRTATPSGTFKSVGAKFMMPMIPALTSRSVTA
jgi:3-oxoacyl-[acyl-carrier-protein] synthase-3